LVVIQHFEKEKRKFKKNDLQNLKIEIIFQKL
jgi:hypothetical protein